MKFSINRDIADKNSYKNYLPNGTVSIEEAMVTMNMSKCLFKEAESPTQKGVLVKWRKSRDNIEEVGSLLLVDIDKSNYTKDNLINSFNKLNCKVYICESQSSEEGNRKWHAVIDTYPPLAALENLQRHIEIHKMIFDEVEAVTGLTFDKALRNNIVQHLKNGKGSVYTIGEGRYSLNKEIESRVEEFNPKKHKIHLANYGEELTTLEQIEEHLGTQKTLACGCAFGDVHGSGTPKADTGAYVARNKEGKIFYKCVGCDKFLSLSKITATSAFDLALIRVGTKASKWFEYFPNSKNVIEFAKHDMAKRLKEAYGVILNTELVTETINKGIITQGKLVERFDYSIDKEVVSVEDGAYTLRKPIPTGKYDIEIVEQYRKHFDKDEGLTFDELLRYIASRLDTNAIEENSLWFFGSSRWGKDMLFKIFLSDWVEHRSALNMIRYLKGDDMVGASDFLKKKPILVVNEAKYIHSTFKEPNKEMLVKHGDSRSVGAKMFIMVSADAGSDTHTHMDEQLSERFFYIKKYGKLRDSFNLQVGAELPKSAIESIRFYCNEMILKYYREGITSERIGKRFKVSKTSDIAKEYVELFIDSVTKLIRASKVRNDTCFKNGLRNNYKVDKKGKLVVVSDGDRGQGTTLHKLSIDYSAFLAYESNDDKSIKLSNIYPKLSKQTTRVIGDEITKCYEVTV